MYTETESNKKKKNNHVECFWRQIHSQLTSTYQRKKGTFHSFIHSFIEHLLCARLYAKRWKLAIHKTRGHLEVNRAQSHKLWGGIWILFYVRCCGWWVVLMAPILYSLHTGHLPWNLAPPFYPNLDLAILLALANGLLTNRIRVEA